MVQNYVIKRNGQKEELSIAKIKAMTAWACAGLKVNPLELEASLNTALKDNISTDNIQNNLIYNAYKKVSITSPGWALVAGRLFISSYRKNIALSRGIPKENPYSLFEQRVKKKVEGGIYDASILEVYSEEELAEYGRMIKPERDLELDYNAAFCLCNLYLLPDELPQELFLVNALRLAIVDPPEERHLWVEKYYNVLSKRLISLATPLLRNLRSPNGNLTSCFILELHDSLDDLFHAFHRIGRISKHGGGVGVYASPVRAQGAEVAGHPNASGGVLPWIKIINDIGVTVNQVGVRAGAITVALDAWHYDLLDFLELQTLNGDQRKKSFDIFPQICIPDLLMNRLENNEDWYLVDPYEVKKVTGCELHLLWGPAFESAYAHIEDAIASGRIKQYKTVKPKDLFKKIIKNNLETGLPYLSFKDTINRGNPNQETGRIPCVNLCVAPETLILTEYGYLPIADLEGQNVNVWNGFEWSEVLIKKTGENLPLLKVNFSNGESLECTYYHHFWIQQGYRGKPIRVEAKDLKPGDQLIKYNLPIVESDTDVDFPYAYTSGAFSGDGSCSNGGHPEINLYGEKKELVSRLTTRNKLWGSRYGSKELDSIAVYDDVKQDQLVCKLPLDIPQKFTVPLQGFTVKSRLEWLAGLLDTDGTVCRNGNNESLSITSVNKQFLLDIRLMLQTLGVDSKVTLSQKEGKRLMPNGKGGSQEYLCQESHRLLISSNGLFQLSLLGLKTYRLEWKARKPQREASQFIKVTEVELTCRKDDTFCFTEHKRHLGMFNGILTGQCVESFSNTSKDLDHCCNLSSVNLAQLCQETLNMSIKEKDSVLRETCRTAVRILDNSIDLTTAPNPQANAHNKLYRTIGVGLVGLADYLAFNEKTYKDLSFISELTEQFSYYCIEASVDLAGERGTFYNYPHSSWAEGITLNGLTASSLQLIGNFPWLTLQNKLRKYGIRNSQITAIAPNTSTSVLMGSTASVLPAHSRSYEITNTLGTMMVIPRFIQDKLWFYQEGINLNPEIVVRAIASMQQWIDTGISMELIFNLKEGIYADGYRITAKDIFEIQKLAWASGCKAIYYIRSIDDQEFNKMKSSDCEACSS